MLFRVSVMDAPVPVADTLLTPVTAALLQVYTGVGVVLVLVISYVLDTLSHQLAVEELLITEVGFTVTDTSN